MSFTIKCDKCGALAENIKDAYDYFPDDNYSDGNQEVTDPLKTIVIRSVASYGFTSQLYIECKCGNEV